MPTPLSAEQLSFPPFDGDWHSLGNSPEGRQKAQLIIERHRVAVNALRQATDGGGMSGLARAVIDLQVRENNLRSLDGQRLYELFEYLAEVGAGGNRPSETRLRELHAVIDSDQESAVLAVAAAGVALDSATGSMADSGAHEFLAGYADGIGVVLGSPAGLMGSYQAGVAASAVVDVVHH